MGRAVKSTRRVWTKWCETKRVTAFLYSTPLDSLTLRCPSFFSLLVCLSVLVRCLLCTFRFLGFWISVQGFKPGSFLCVVASFARSCPPFLAFRLPFLCSCPLAYRAAVIVRLPVFLSLHVGIWDLRTRVAGVVVQVLYSRVCITHHG